MKRSEAIQSLEVLLFGKAGLDSFSFEFASKILDFCEFEIGMNPPGNPSGESECGWGEENPKPPVQGPPTVMDMVIQHLATQMEKDLYSSNPVYLSVLERRALLHLVRKK